MLRIAICDDLNTDRAAVRQGVEDYLAAHPNWKCVDPLQALSPGQFITPYRGYIINQDAIRTITAEGIQLHDGASTPLKEGDFRKTRNAYFQWAFQKEGMK